MEGDFQAITKALMKKSSKIIILKKYFEWHQIRHLSELDAVAKMAAYWNVPIIGYMASGTAFVDKTIYKTLARVSLRTTNSLAEAVAALLRHFNWKKVQNLITISFLVNSVNSEKSIPFEYQQG